MTSNGGRTRTYCAGVTTLSSRRSRAGRWTLDELPNAVRTRAAGAGPNPVFVADTPNGEVRECFDLGNLTAWVQTASAR
jgi:hypothetical protein